MGIQDTGHSLHIDSIHLSDVNHFDIWDRRESAVANAHDWHAACESYRATPNCKNGIPHTIHQIWIGQRQPPCVWLDTWRIDFMSRFRNAADKRNAPVPGPLEPWTYTLWTNDRVRDMPMLNRALFDAESAPQCQADILRLEVLYEYGGVYIDADIVSTVRDLRPALAAARETGFMITYEPDTRDKPYSILGNSIIACTPRHPLILMLMSYIKRIYPEKRHLHGVEWVTGPLTYSKVLVDTGMPMHVPPQKDFYPAFHYVPNPSAIDVTSFDSYCFQFGYTCSGLSQWVAENNTCRNPLECYYHCNQRYPLGKLKRLPPAAATTSTDDVEIPKTIHQFCFQREDAQPDRWLDTWRKDFCPAAGFKHELWTWARLRDELGAFFCASLYNENRLDDAAVSMLALEVLYERGGYYVPLSTLYTGGEGEEAAQAADAIFGKVRRGRFETLSIVGFPPKGPAERIRAAQGGGCLAVEAELPNAGLPAELTAEMRFADGLAAQTEFKDGSRYLGASEIYYRPEAAEGGKSNAVEAGMGSGAAMAWAYDCQVPIFKVRDDDDALLDALKTSGKRAVVITDAQFGSYSTLVNELPGVMYRYEQAGVDWDFIAICVEWEVDGDGLCEYVLTSPHRPPTARFLGYIVNGGGAAHHLHSPSIDGVLALHGSGRVRVASEKSRHSGNLTAVFRAMPSVERACRALSDFVPSFDREHDELHDSLFKAFRGGQIAYELQTDEEGRVMFRSWGDNGSINCECKVTPQMNGVLVDNLRLFDGPNVGFEASGKFVR